MRRSAISCRVAPSERISPTMRRASGEYSIGRPKRAPRAFAAAIASRVRAPIRRRSYWATDANRPAVNSPLSVDRSKPSATTTIAQPRRRERSTSSAHASRLRVTRSRRATTSAAAAPATSRASSAGPRAGRRSGATEPLTPASTTSPTRTQSRSAMAARAASSCTAMPRPSSACSSVGTRAWANARRGGPLTPSVSHDGNPSCETAYPRASATLRTAR